MLNRFKLLTPSSLDEAFAELAKHGSDCKIFAGGTDVLVEMHGGKIYTCLMDIKNVKELKGVRESAGGLDIGALTTHRELEMMPLIRKRYSALYDGVSQVGAVQTRSRGTLGGNICNAVPSGDSLSPLLALGARLTVQGADGVREMPFEEFFLGPKKTALKQGELLSRIYVPAPEADSGSAYTKFTRRKAMDLALLGCAVYIVVKDGVCKNIRISLTTSAPTVMRAKQAEQVLVQKPVTEEAILQAGLTASEEARPRSSWRSSEEYRRELLKEIVPRTIHSALVHIRKGDK